MGRLDQQISENGKARLDAKQRLDVCGLSMHGDQSRGRAYTFVLWRMLGE